MKKVLFIGIVGLLLSACGLVYPMHWINWSMRGPVWGAGGYRSEGERIFFTGTNEQGIPIPYRGGVFGGGMMMQSQLACVDCHGPDGRGGIHRMHMQVMDAPDIRYQALNSDEDEHGTSKDSLDHPMGEYDLDMFRQAVVYGKHPDGEALRTEMPRWNLPDEELQAVFDYLKSIP